MQADVLQLRGATRSDSTQSPISLSGCAHAGPCLACECAPRISLSSCLHLDISNNFLYAHVASEANTPHVKRSHQKPKSILRSYLLAIKPAPSYISFPQELRIIKFLCFSEEPFKLVSQGLHFDVRLFFTSHIHTVHRILSENSLDLAVDCLRIISL